MNVSTFGRGMGSFLARASKQAALPLGVGMGVGVAAGAAHWSYNRWGYPNRNRGRQLNDAYGFGMRTGMYGAGAFALGMGARSIYRRFR